MLHRVLFSKVDCEQARHSMSMAPPSTGTALANNEVLSLCSSMSRSACQVVSVS